MPPRPFFPTPGSTIVAQSYGSACPQLTGRSAFALTAVDEISEDCLNLNIVRPRGGYPGKLPVMVYIYGGSFWVGQNRDDRTTPDGLILQSIANHHPVIHVSINYRLGIFGFATSESLRAKKSENEGMRDQRLALEWVQDNIASFGGDPTKLTVFGQSSGGER